MVGIKNNRRVQYTRDQLKRALIALLSTQPLASVTVTAICQEADVNRGTFYAHYDNPAALFHEIERDLVKQVTPLIHSEADLMSWLPQVLAVVAQADTATAIILQNIEASPVLQTILQPLRTQTLRSYAQRFSESDPALLNYYFDYYFNGAIHVITRWLANDAKESPEAIATIIANVANA
ncbi:TetR/AcrR family transcriptional regulator [Lacticaseibacillus sp. GG6-2]